MVPNDSTFSHVRATGTSCPRKAVLAVKIIQYRIQFEERKYKTFRDLELF